MRSTLIARLAWSEGPYASGWDRMGSVATAAVWVDSGGAHCSAGMHCVAMVAGSAAGVTAAAAWPR